MNIKTAFSVMGLNGKVDNIELKKKFRELSKKYHPDLDGGDEQKMSLINEAYKLLSDELKVRESITVFEDNFDFYFEERKEKKKVLLNLESIMILFNGGTINLQNEQEKIKLNLENIKDFHIILSDKLKIKIKNAEGNAEITQILDSSVNCIFNGTKRIKFQRIEIEDALFGEKALIKFEMYGKEKEITTKSDKLLFKIDFGIIDAEFEVVRVEMKDTSDE